MIDPFANLPRRYFATAMIDVPWKFLARSQKGEGRSPKYQTMTLDWIKALPVAELMLPDSVLLFWVTDPFFEIGFEVLQALGFTFKTIGFHWTKLNQNGTPFTGMGFYSRANPEICLLATRGQPKRLGKDVRRLIEMVEPEERLIRSPRREHSRKPDEAYARTQALLEGPYLDLFSRESRPGWTCWGHEAKKFDPPRIYSPEILRLLDGPKRRLI